MFAQNLPGGNLIPFALLSLGSAGLFSVIALVTAFFHRTQARRFAIASCSAIGAFLFLLLLTNSWKPASVFDVLMHTWELTGFGCVALLTAIIAWAVSLAHDTRATQPNALRRNRAMVVCGYGILAVGTAVTGGLRISEHSTGEKKTTRLLAGDSDVRFTRLQAVNQQRRLICTDPQVLRYLEQQFRIPDSGISTGGTSYQLTLEYEGKGTHYLGSYWWDAEAGGFQLMLRDPDEANAFRTVLLPSPRHPSVEQLIRFLDAPIHEVRGQVLIMTANGSHVEYDRSLLAE